ncbi:MAG: LysM peptidoglycan-binding domain-containing protein [Treponema sp.]|jgi:LysM repeat protein|nr:LysM peptidoglycan-binding domain-containing protein [Treponema sp.]
MKKTFSFFLAIIAALLVVSCKSAPVAAEPEANPDADLQFTSAYETVMPIIFDNAQNYTVKWGDTLIKIARKAYGQEHVFLFPLIMAASKEKKTVDIVDPDLIKPGMELVIPDLALNLDNAEITARIKALLESVSTIYDEKPSDIKWSHEVRDGLIATAETL